MWVAARRTNMSAWQNLRDVKMERVHITQHSSLGAAWFAGWLFTIGYLRLDFWIGLPGLFVWPYFIGSHFVSPAV